VIVPVITAVPWPAVGAAVMGVAAAMGYGLSGAAVKEGFSFFRKRVKAETDDVTPGPEVPIENTEVKAEELAQVKEFVLKQEGITIRIRRKNDGKMAVCAEGKGKTKAELEAIAKKVGERLVQQLVYNRVVTELKSNDFKILEQNTEEGDHIRIRVARWI